MDSPKEMDSEFVVLEGWMKDLDLKPSELICYAVIYGYTFNGIQGAYTGSRANLAKWMNGDIRTVARSINALKKAGLIEIAGKSGKFVKYIAIPPTEELGQNVLLTAKKQGQNVLHQEELGQNVLLNGEELGQNVLLMAKKQGQNVLHQEELGQNVPISRTKCPTEHIENKYIDIGVEQDFKKNAGKKKTTKPFDVDQAVRSSFQNEEASEAMYAFLEMRKQMKKPVTTERAFNGLVNKLKKLAKSEDEMIQLIDQSTERCWSSFYPLKGNSQDSADKSDQQGFTANPAAYL